MTMESSPDTSAREENAPVCIVTGLSGAGKSVALRVFEDLGYFTVDGLPASLTPEMVGMMRRPSMEHFRGIALGMDLRQNDFLRQLNAALLALAEEGVRAQVLFVEAHTSTLLRRYAAADHRLRVFTQANRGVSAARNRALRETQGDYILCVDSDDFLRPDALEQLCRCANETDADIVLGRAQVRGADGAFYEMFPRPDAVDGVQCLRGDLLYAALMPTFAFPPVVYQYLCKRSFLLENSLFFREGIVHEDELWCAQVMCLAARAALSDACHYDYLPRAGSIMQSDNLAYRVESMFVVAQALQKFAEAQKYYLSPAAQ